MESWTLEELREELARFEAELRAAGLKDPSVQTYVGRTTYFLRWLVDDYHPTGPKG